MKKHEQPSMVVQIVIVIVLLIIISIGQCVSELSKAGSGEGDYKEPDSYGCQGCEGILEDGCE